MAVGRRPRSTRGPPINPALHTIVCRNERNEPQADLAVRLHHVLMVPPPGNPARTSLDSSPSDAITNCTKALPKQW